MSEIHEHENNDNLSVEQIIGQCRELNQLRDQYGRRLSVMQDRHAASVAELKKLVAEMSELGTSPQTIRADLTKEQENLKARLQEQAKNLDQLNQLLNDAESVWTQTGPTLRS